MQVVLPIRTSLKRHRKNKKRMYGLILDLREALGLTLILESFMQMQQYDEINDRVIA